MPRCPYCGGEHYTAIEELECKENRLIEQKEAERGGEKTMAKAPAKKPEEKEGDEGYEPVGGGEIIQFDTEGVTVVGKLQNIREGQYKNKVYDILTPEGKAVTVFGTTILDRIMQTMVAGDEIKIRYTGELPVKKKGMNPAKNFEVFRKKKQ